MIALGGVSLATRNPVEIGKPCLYLTSALASNWTLKAEALERADTALKTADARYVAGDISLMEVPAARRDWAAALLSYFESLRDVMQA